MLNDIGERRLIKKRIKKIIKTYGGNELVLDDSAPFKYPLKARNLWITTDPSPVPNLVHRIGMGNYYHSGWFCILKSISDLCAVGATPLVSTVAVDFPFNLSIEEFDQFFIGVVECAKSHGTILIGGNIKEAFKKQPHAVSTCVGYTHDDKYLKRGKARPGDLVFLVDKKDFGGFWAGIAIYLNKNKNLALTIKVQKEIQNFALKPMAKHAAASLMLKHSSISFCMDNSDGLLSSIFELSELSSLDVVISIKKEMFSPTIAKIANSFNCDSRIWGLGWGDCNLLCATDRENFVKLRKKLKKIDSEPIVVGIVREGTGKVLIDIDSNKFHIKNIGYLSGEQFNLNSFWQCGINSYVEKMMKSNLKEFLFE